MYERNAIVLERYFNQMFGFNTKNNIKTNFKDYCELVECLEKYKNISEEEENIMQEYDSIANRIREIQKTQETLNKKNLRYQQERASIFQNIDESSETIQKKLDNINNNIQNINEEIEENAQNFVQVVAEFTEETSVRTNCGRTRRSIENEYNQKLNETLDNYQDIDIEYQKRAKQFIDIETQDIEKELKEKMKKNGEKEKITFDENVLTKAIVLCVDIQKRETDILANIYDKTNRLFTEIKNNVSKIEKHKKTIRDSKSKLEFLAAIKEYLIQFLDNERLTAVNGEEEHKKLMEEACKNFDEDLVQINNLYGLLLKEIGKKITKKSYSEAYNIDYLKNLEKKAEEFDSEIKKLNLPVTIINPNYWRIEGMKKIYDVFYKNVTEVYGRDLSEYITIEEEPEEYDEIEEETKIQEPIKQEEKQQNKGKTKKEKDTRAEIDKKIDMILGLEDNSNWEEDDDEDLDDEDFFDDEENTEEDIDYDIWGNNLKKKNQKPIGKSTENDDIEEDIFDDDEDFGEDDEEDLDIDLDYEEDNDENEEDDEDFSSYNEEDEFEENEEDFEEKSNYKEKSDKTKRNKKETIQEDSWEDEFINIDKKDNNKKKKSFFDKFKK